MTVDDLRRITEGDGSKYNGALDTVMRISRRLEECHVYSIRMLHNEWMNTLDDLRLELLPVLTSDELAEIDRARPSGFLPPVKISGSNRPGNYPPAMMRRYEGVIRVHLAKKGLLLVAGKDRSAIILGGAD